MLTENNVAHQDLLHGLQAGYESGMTDGLLGKARAKAWDRFLELGLPTRRDEAFRSIRLHELLSRNYEQAPELAISEAMVDEHLLPECIDAVLVFANGHYLPALSRTGAIDKETQGRLVVETLANAIRTYGPFLNNRWKKAIKEEADPFAALNAAAYGEAAFFYLPPSTVVETPIQLLHFVSGSGQPVVVQPRQQIFAGKSAEAHFIRTVVPLGGESVWINHGIDVAVDENANVTVTEETRPLPASWWYTSAVRAELQRASKFQNVALTKGAATTRNSYVLRLCGEGASGALIGLAALGDRREAHTHILMDHQAPHCDSRQLFKTVLDDNSRASFEGKILVRQPAQKTDAFQLNNNLVLSDKAHADSKPNLEIFADDVKASHGATVGQLDTEELFYLQTRGLSDESAKRILVKGFMQEVLDTVKVPSLLERA